MDNQKEHAETLLQYRQLVTGDRRTEITAESEVLFYLLNSVSTQPY